LDPGLRFGIALSVNTPWGKADFATPMIGAFNAQNLLGVFSDRRLRTLLGREALEELVRGRRHRQCRGQNVCPATH
jgi:hypothetical protein